METLYLSQSGIHRPAEEGCIVYLESFTNRISRERYVPD